MKTNKLSILSGMALALLLSSCVVSEHRHYRHDDATVGTVGIGVSAGYYDTLPSSYDQPYYLYNNRYYYGGRWEQGRFMYQGHMHEGRYYHNGQYYYGGRYTVTHSRRRCKFYSVKVAINFGVGLWGPC